MQELEIKLQVPPHELASIDAALSQGQTHRRTRLRAAYFDTAQRHLARAGIALRVRQEGRRRVQTLKAAGDDALTRFEHNVVIGPQDAVDPARHAGTSGGDRLLSLLAETGLPLIETYRTDILRRTRVLRVGRQQVELALDVGHIVAGEQRLPVCELEIELVEGTPHVVLQTARRWARQHGLWIDVRSKAERGDRLARGEAIGAPARAASIELPAEATVGQGWQAVVRASLRHLLPNASELACPQAPAHTASLVEHVHQLRVGLRRFRAAARLFQGWPGVPEMQPLAQAARAVFQQLGAARDADVIAALLTPVWREAGLPPCTWEADDNTSLAQPLRAEPVQTLWLELMAGAYRELPTEGGVALKPLAAKRLKRWHRDLAASVDRFDAMEDAERHALRKRIKRMRYAVDAVGSLFASKGVRKYVKALASAQQAFGDFNDVCTARLLLLGRTDASSLYALGWLTARREALLPACRDSLAALAEAPKFWK